MAADIKIERVDVNVTSNGQTYTLSNDVGNTTNAFVRVMSATDKTSGGPTLTTANSAPDRVSCGVELTGTNQLTFYLPSNVTSRKMILEVWRYTGSSGGAYEFQTKARGSIVVLTGTSSSTTSALPILNRNNCVPLHCGYVSNETSTSDYEGHVFALHIDGDDRLVLSRNNNGTGENVTIYYEIVEFTGSAWNVGHGVSSSHDSTMETVTLNTDSRGIGGSTFDVGNWETAMIIEATMEGDSSETGLADCIALCQPSATTSTVEFGVTDADGSARNDGTAYIHVLQCDDLIVKRDTNTNVIEGNGSYGTPLSMPAGVNGSTPIDELGLEWFVSTNGTGTAHARGRLHAKIVDNSGYEIQHWVHRSGNTVRAYYGVADLSALEDVGASRRKIQLMV